MPADPDVALQHLGGQVPQRLLEDVLAGGAARRAAGDDALEALQAGTRVLLDRLPGRQGRAQTLDDGLGLGQPLAQLGRLGVLGDAAALEPAAQLGDVPSPGRRRAAPGSRPAHATPPIAASTHTRSSANNSSSADILWIVARKMGIDKSH